MNKKVILVFNAYETVKKHYGKEVLVTINIPVESADGNIKGYQYYSTENVVLKPMPEKRLDVLDEDTWQAGWNDCIDEILGEEDD